MFFDIQYTSLHTDLFLSNNLHFLELRLNLPLQPPLVSDHLSQETSFPKYQKFPSQIITAGTSQNQPSLILKATAATTFRASSETQGQ